MMSAFILFVQHGWADDHRAMMALAEPLVTSTTPVVAPNLGFIQTWLRIAPLIQRVEQIAIAQIAANPGLPLRIIGHSMGGLIWLEVLHRHPEWWAMVDSFVLIASPVGGADLGRIIDPLNLGIGIAADLGVNRKPMAEAIAAVIPTLVIAGDVDGGSDGTVLLDCTRFASAQFVCLPGLSHSVLRNHPSVATVIQEFWLSRAIGEVIAHNDIVQRLRAVPGMTDAHQRDFRNAKVAMHLLDGSTVRTWRNPVMVKHVFVADAKGKCLYSGFVGWLHIQDLEEALDDIRQAYAYPAD
jgi:pimeloyl-ACP methyl ester carboxylesterase